MSLGLRLTKVQNLSTAIIIFSRHNSTRLPGKALKLIHGREMLGWVIDRARLVNNDIPVIVATSSERQDDQIAEFSQNNGAFCFRGDLNNVLKRAIDACKAFDIDVFARVCGDRPFFSPELTLSGFRQIGQNKAELVSSQVNQCLPPGLTTEIIKLSALEKITKLSQNEDDLEHITRFIYNHKAAFDIKEFVLHEPIKNWAKLVVDNSHDLNRARWIALKLTKSYKASSCYKKILYYAEEYDRSE